MDLNLGRYYNVQACTYTYTAVEEKCALYAPLKDMTYFSNTAHVHTNTF